MKHLSKTSDTLSETEEAECVKNMGYDDIKTGSGSE
jgi:hypothetical protein